MFGLFGAALDGYGWLTDDVHGVARWLIVAVLRRLRAPDRLRRQDSRAAARRATGSAGNAVLSPASLVATATFFGTAIAVSFLIEALT